MSFMPTDPATDNADQIAEWNGATGQTWAQWQREIDSVVIPFGEAALRAAAAEVGERVIDVGCGCGDTSIELARLVGSSGAVLGVDVSRPMLEVARSQAAQAGHSQLAFREADASVAEMPSGTDLLFSRFGVMFFGQPTKAFGHMRKSLRPGGRCVFVCWRPPRDNPWTMAPLSAARAAMRVTPPAADPHAPGPFAFADDTRLRGILKDAGFGSVEIQRFDTPLTLGATPQEAAERALLFGPTRRFLREMGEEHYDAIFDAITNSLAPLAASDGRVSLNGSTWMVSAKNPA
jgi:SAM-dependent methyltransferase